ncbi:MAG: hypothetical protein FJ145_03355 [Deltaproteobacteria bacterium]|nr:hypothetical protein [Deltaproteobacteria bacterium]
MAKTGLPIGFLSGIVTAIGAGANHSGDATELINRSLAEARAGKPAFDMTLGNEVVMTALDEKGLLTVFEPPAAKA